MEEIIEVIKERRSVRTYDPAPLGESDRERLADYISRLDNPFGIEVRIAMVDKTLSDIGEKLGTYGVIKGAQTFMGVIVPDLPLAPLAAGYQFERLVLYATSIGLGTVWLAATFSRSKFAEAMGVRDDELFPAISPVGYPASIRMAEKLMRVAIRADKRKAWKYMFFDGDFNNPLTPDAAGDFATPLEMLRLAPSSTNSQPWRVLKSGDKWHFFAVYKDEGAERSSSAVIKQVDLGIGISHFHLSLPEALRSRGRFVQSAPEGIELPRHFHYLISFCH